MTPPTRETDETRRAGAAAFDAGHTAPAASDIVELRKAFGRADTKTVWLALPALFAEIERLRALPSTAETPSAWRDAMAKLIEASENIANQLERIGDYRKDRFFIQDVRDAIQAIRALIPPKEKEG